jgi:hypothetical protein
MNRTLRKKIGIFRAILVRDLEIVRFQGKGKKS